jgi:hypothetical protein
MNAVNILSALKGQLISKRLFGVFNFLQRTNENKSHSSKVEFVRSFFGGNVRLRKSFRLCLTFTYTKTMCSFHHKYKSAYTTKYQNEKRTSFLPSFSSGFRLSFSFCNFGYATVSYPFFHFGVIASFILRRFYFPFL